jgi:hypothetical protein
MLHFSRAAVRNSERATQIERDKENIMQRCSALPKFFACGQSLGEESDDATDATPAVEHDNPAAHVGTATHEVLRLHLGDAFDPAMVEHICAGHGVDQGEVWPLVNVGKKILAELGLGKPTAMEQELSDGDLSGHPDAEWVQPGQYVIGDWKTSRLDGSYYHQLMGYAWLRHDSIRACGGRCLLFASWLRDGTVERYLATTETVEAWHAEYKALAAQRDRPFVTGGHCTYCQRASDCPAQHEDLRQALATIDGDAALDVSKLDGPTVARVHRKLKMLASVKEKWDEALKVRIKSLGPVDCGDGHTLAVVEENGKREVDTAAAWPILTKELDADEMAGCVSISIRKAEDAVAKKAGRGKGAAAVRLLTEELTKVNAVRQGVTWKLKEIRNQNVKKEIA